LSTSNPLTTKPQKSTEKGIEFSDADVSNIVSDITKGGFKLAWNNSITSAMKRHANATLPAPEEIEQIICTLPTLTEPEAKQLQNYMTTQRAHFIKNLSKIGRLESSAAAALARELNAYNAVAALCGRSTRYLLRRTAVLLGRASAPGTAAVDVDLSTEAVGAEKAVSREQAHLFLDIDNVFKIRCLGRRSLFVNGEEVKQGFVAAMPHLSLVKAGPVVLLFVVNRLALDRIQRRTNALNVC
jgi:hypothetical protein